jgi:hypothetical protein
VWAGGGRVQCSSTLASKPRPALSQRAVKAKIFTAYF